MSRDAVMRALREQREMAERLAGSAWEGAKTGAEVTYRAGAGLLGAPQEGSGKGSFRTTGNFRPGVDPALMDAIERAAIRNGYIVEAYSGKNARSSKTKNHPSGRAADIRIMDPATGKPLGGDASPDMSPKLFRKYEAFANDVHKEFVAANPAREKDFRWGGYFVQGTPMDLMHFDVSGGNMAAGNFKTGLKRQYAQAWNVPGASPVQANAGAVSSGDPQVAAMQRVLNSRGAAIPVDGIMGPLTRGAMAKYGPQAPAQAYAPVPAATPALQAAAGQAYGRPDPQVAAMQRDLNSRGAQLKVDGLRGPLTRAAEQQFLGSPTSVRTPSFTAPMAVSAGVTTPRTPYLNNPYTSPTVPQTPGYQAPYSGPAPTPKTPYLNNPYTSSTGGSINPNVRSVPTIAVRSDVRSKSPLPSYYDSQLGNDMTVAGGRRVPTTAGYAPTTGPVLTGGFSPPTRAPTPQTPAYQNPYTMSTGGANAIVQPVQTARMPQARPAYPPPSAPASGPTLMQQLQDQMQRAAAVAAEVANRAKDAYSQGTRSGMGYSGGGGYTGGSYGGAGGRSIGAGVGGAFRNR